MHDVQQKCCFEGDCITADAYGLPLARALSSTRHLHRLGPEGYPFTCCLGAISTVYVYLAFRCIDLIFL